MSIEKTDMDETQFGAIEGALAGTLRRVQPRREFVQRLRRHIHLPERAAIALRFQDWERLVLVFGGVLSGGVVILTIARAMYHLFGRRSG